MKLPVIVCLVLFWLCSPASAQEDVKLRDKALEFEKKLSTNPALVALCVDANRKPVDELEIMREDQKWRSTKGKYEFGENMLKNPTSKFLRELQKNEPAINEAFLTDRAGRNLALTHLTPDFYQGDEEKISKVLETNGVFIARRKFDASTRSAQRQVSIPIRQDEVVVGVLVVGMDPRALE